MRWLAILVIAIVTTVGCDLVSTVDKPITTDLELEPVTQQQVEASFNSSKSKSSFKQSPYVCIVSTKNKMGAEYKYTYRAYWLHFPKALVAEANGEKQHIIYNLDDKETLRLARCTIPRTKRAYDAMVELLEFKIEKDKVTTKPKEGNTEHSKLMCKETYWETVYVFSMDGRLLDVYTTLVCVDTPLGGGGGGSTPDPGGGGTDWGDDYPTGGGGDDTWEDHGDESDPCAGPEITIGCADKPDIPSFNPCAGDPVSSPEIAPSSGSGINGGRWGWTRTNPDGTPKYHAGLDIKSSIDGPLYSIFSGTVYSAGAYSTDFGNYIIIRSNYNGETIYILYAHLNSVSVDNGSLVAAGQLIGATGKTGNAGGPNVEPHVHIEVRKKVHELGYNNAPDYNPEDFIATKFDENGNPIPPDNCN